LGFLKKPRMVTGARHDERNPDGLQLCWRENFSHTDARALGGAQSGQKFTGRPNQSRPPVFGNWPVQHHPMFSTTPGASAPPLLS
jgi:hypothetical protein